MHFLYMTVIQQDISRYYWQFLTASFHKRLSNTQLKNRDLVMEASMDLHYSG